VLYVDGKAAIAQSRSIERFLAKQFGLAGTTDVQAAQMDMWTEHIRDVQDKYQKAKNSKDAESSDPVAKWMTDDLPGLLAKLDKVAALTSTTPGCAVGDSLTLADVKLWMFAGAQCTP
jgi:glutathione S-transferase